MNRRPFIVRKWSQADQAWPVHDRATGARIGTVTTAGPWQPYTATAPDGSTHTERSRFMACCWLLARASAI